MTRFHVDGFADPSEVPAEEQRRAARESRDWYIKSGLADSGEFDRLLMDLFNRIEACDPDIDSRIEQMRTFWQTEGLIKKYRDALTLSMVVKYQANKLMRRDKALGKPNGMWQLRCNWYRLLRITNSDRHQPFTVAPKWIGPWIPPADVEGPLQPPT